MIRRRKWAIITTQVVTLLVGVGFTFYKAHKWTSSLNDYVIDDFGKWSSRTLREWSEKYDWLTDL